MNTAIFLVGFLVSYLLTPKILSMLDSGGLSRINYQGKKIPCSAGVIFPAALAVTYVFFFLWEEVSTDSLIFLGLAALISLSGLVDDTAGNRNETGFKGHVILFIKSGQLSTGLWKAGMGGLAAVLAAVSESLLPGEILVNSLVVALSVNFFNLLDVRPGRSIKVFFIAAVLIAVLLPSYTGNILLYPLAGIVAAYAVYDLRSQAMLGDAGANVIGLAVGLSVMAGGSMTTKLLLLALLIILHIISEYHSFSVYIERNSVLNYLDRLGRR